jgi:hypothetical protein
MTVIVDQTLKNSNNHNINLNLIETSRKKIIFINQEMSKETFLETIKMVESRYTNYSTEFEQTIINIDRKFDIFLNKISNSQLFQILIHDEDKACLSIKFIPSRNINNSFYILNKNNDIVVIVDYDFINLFDNPTLSLNNIHINFLRINELRDIRNLHYDHKIEFFHNKLADNTDLRKKLEFQLNAINNMKKNLCIHMLVLPEKFHYKMILENNLKLNYRLLTRYTVGSGMGYQYVPPTSYISDDLEHFYKYMDLFWQRKSVTEPNKIMTNTKIVQRYLRKYNIVDSHLLLQPAEILKPDFDTVRLYFCNDRFYIKITDTLNLSTLYSEKIYTDSSAFSHLYTLYDFVKKKDEIILLFEMMEI